MKKRRAIKKAVSSKGIVFALVTDGETFEVWKECQNYERTTPGGIAKTWRYVAKGMDEPAATSLFNRRVS